MFDISNCLATFYPESRFGGFSDVDGTMAFYLRVNSLLSSQSVVADFGCGAGEYSSGRVEASLRQRVLKGKVRTVVGLDVDASAALNPFIDEFHKVCEGSRWSLTDSSVDLILCDQVLEHIRDVGWFFSEARRVLRSGGHLCIRTTNAFSYVGFISRLVPNKWHKNVLRTVQRNRKQDDVFPTVYRCNTVWALRRALARQGFDAVVYGHGAEPSYLEFSKAAYAFGVLLHKLSPSAICPALFAFGRVLK
jgi:SAM-dependent methyltransferase